VGRFEAGTMTGVELDVEVEGCINIELKNRRANGARLMCKPEN